MPELLWLQSLTLLVLAILAVALVALTIVIGSLTKDLRWFLLAGLLSVVYFLFFVLRYDSFRETSFYQWLEQKPNQSLLPLLAAVLVVSVIVLILETGRRTKDIRWFLLASLLTVVYYLFIVLGTGFSENWHSLPLLLGFVVYLGYVWFGGSSAQLNSHFGPGNRNQSDLRCV